MRLLYLCISTFGIASTAHAQNYNYGGSNYGLNGGVGTNVKNNYGSNQYGGNQYGGNNYNYNSAQGNQYGGNNYNYNSTQGNQYGGNNYNYNSTQGNQYGGNNYNNTQGNGYGGGNYNYGGDDSYGGNAYSQDAGANAYSNPSTNYAIPNYAVPVDNLINGTNAYGNAGTNYVPQNSSQTAPVAEQQLPPGPPAEQDFQFESNGAPGIHVYKLKWPDSNRNLQTIEVYKAESGELVQSLPVPQEGLRLVYSELLEPTAAYANNLRDQFIDIADYNFDNLSDIRLTKEWPYAAGSKMYMIWLYNQEKDQYQLANELSALPAPYPDTKAKRIESVTLTGWGGAEYIKNIYTISTEGQLRIDTRITNTIFDRQKLWFVRDVRTRIGGELQRVCKFLMRSEGVPKRLWGRPENCREYLVKGPPMRRKR